MSVEKDLQILATLPSVKIWGVELDNIQQHKIYRGKFVLTEDGRVFAKLFPKSKWDQIEYFHDMVVSELGIQDAESMDVKEVIIGGGKIEVELVENHLECRLFGKSTIYGDYDANDIDPKPIEEEIQEVFECEEMPVSVERDFEE